MEEDSCGRGAATMGIRGRGLGFFCGGWMEVEGWVRGLGDQWAMGIERATRGQARSHPSTIHPANRGARRTHQSWTWKKQQRGENWRQ